MKKRYNYTIDIETGEWFKQYASASNLNMSLFIDKFLKETSSSVVLSGTNGKI